MTDEKPKLSKKERKALEFKQKKKRSLDSALDAEPAEAEPTAASGTKRVKTEKPDTGATLAKPKAAKHPPRFILFVGNLPYDVDEQKLRDHFKTATPTTVRLRKGYAFVEFEGSEATKNLNLALRYHHTQLGHRKINVELTAGGGGNSDNRRKKLEKKNTALQEELSERLEQERLEKSKARANAAAAEKKKEKVAKKTGAKAKKEGLPPADLKHVHPDRLRNMTG